MMKFLRFFVILLAFCIPQKSRAWIDPSQSYEDYAKSIDEKFDSISNDMMTKFDRLLLELNNEYIEILGKPWEFHDAQKDDNKSFSPKPDMPKAPKASSVPENREITYGKIYQSEKQLPDIPATLPDVKSGVVKKYPNKFLFYNTLCGFGPFKAPAISLSVNNIHGVNKEWQKFTNTPGLVDLRNDCLRIREELQLCDWGYLLLVEKIAAELYPASDDNQALAAAALLNLSGYDCKVAAGDEHFYMIFHPSHEIYLVPYYTFNNNKRYYIRSRNEKVARIGGCVGDFYKSPTPIRMLIDRYPRLNPDLKTARRYKSADNNISGKEIISVETVVNSSVQKFLADYPLVSWNLYGLAPVSKELKKSLFKTMEQELAGLGEVEAVNKLLEFHSHGFDYKRDDVQFGREKPFFFDENFYYPANDCEDRAIMFARLVKDVIGLDVVYLKFPDHLAAGVCFSPGVDVNGPSVIVDGKKYVLCDPTGGERVGISNPKYMNICPDVYKVEL